MIESPPYPYRHYLLAAAAAEGAAQGRRGRAVGKWFVVARPSLEEIFRGSPEVEGTALAYRGYGYRLCEIAAHLGLHYVTVSRRPRKFGRAQRPNPAV
ncbi:hypothetical protein H5T55_06275 [Candidatus Bipolaricaulota bacterium]|nr:hypothetical protein [Candidatus Bipolaricaulota bacterium]